MTNLESNQQHVETIQLESTLYAGEAMSCKFIIGYLQEINEIIPKMIEKLEQAQHFYEQKQANNKELLQYLKAKN